MSNTDAWGSDSRAVGLAFGARLNSALDAIGAPAKHRGRIAWLLNEYNARDPHNPVRGESVRRWLSGSLPKHARVPVIARIVGVRSEWLLAGSGPRTPETEPPAVADTPGLYPVSAPERSLLDLYRRLDQRERSRLHRILTAFCDDDS